MRIAFRFRTRIGIVLSYIVLLSSAVCALGTADSVKIVQAVPPIGTKLTRGATVHFEFKVRYELRTAKTGKLTVVTQDQIGNRIGNFQPKKTVEMGTGEITIWNVVFIPDSAKSVNFFTPLFTGGVSAGTVDKVSYSVTSSLSPGPGSGESQEKILSLRFPDLELQSFLPTQKETGDAALEYIEAIKILDQDIEAQKVAGDLKARAIRPLSQKAMARVFAGAHYRNCDLSQYYPPAGSYLTQKLPDFDKYETLIGMMRCTAEDYLQKNNRSMAAEIGAAIIAFGTHLRQSAYSLVQYTYGYEIQSIGFEVLGKTSADPNTSARIKKNIGLLDKTEEIFIEKQANFRKGVWQLTPPLPKSIKAFFLFLDDQEPICRIDALQTIATWYDEKNNGKLGLDKDKNYRTFRSSLKSTREDLRTRIQKMSVGDSDNRVRVVSLIVLNGL